MESVARDLSISVTTLERWRAEALSRPARERAWTAAARFEAVLVTAAMDEAGKSAWCRERGVYPQELEQWRQVGHARPGRAGGRTRQPSRDQGRPAAHQGVGARVTRKDKALAETAALLVLSKKLEAIFHKDKDEDA
jgi:transposase